MRAATASYEHVPRKILSRAMRTRCSGREYGAVNPEKCRRFVRRVKRDRSLKRARVVTAT